MIHPSEFICRIPDIPIMHTVDKKSGPFYVRDYIKMILKDIYPHELPVFDACACKGFTVYRRWTCNGHF